MKNILNTIRSTDVSCFGTLLSYDMKIRGVATKTLLRIDIMCDSGNRTEQSNPDNIGHWGVDTHYQVGKRLVGKHAEDPLVIAVATQGLKMHPDATSGSDQDVEAFLMKFGTEEDIE